MIRQMVVSFTFCDFSCLRRFLHVKIGYRMRFRPKISRSLHRFCGMYNVKMFWS